jgi:prepilin-type processing-associated H-X9-DG protein
MSDGSSTTALMAEWVAGPGLIDLRDPAATVFETPDLLGGRGNLARFESECRSLNTSSAIVADNGKGVPWILAGYVRSLYNHNLRVNRPSCWSGGLVKEGAYTAGSRHPGGANVLFVDGHTVFVKNSIDESVWRSIGTRNGGEVSEASF